MTHEQSHANLDRILAPYRRDLELVKSDDYNVRGAAQAGLNACSGPRYHNALADHLRVHHRCEAANCWPTTEELEAAHDQAHAVERAPEGVPV